MMSAFAGAGSRRVHVVFADAKYARTLASRNVCRSPVCNVRRASAGEWAYGRSERGGAGCGTALSKKRSVGGC